MLRLQHITENFPESVNILAQPFVDMPCLYEMGFSHLVIGPLGTNFRKKQLRTKIDVLFKYCRPSYINILKGSYPQPVPMKSN
jgi:hypothetical protein